MLNAYRQQTTRLLHDLSAVNFSLGDIDTYINIARGQIAGEAECIRVYAGLSVGPNSQDYPFSAISLPAGAAVAGVINVRMVQYQIPGTTGHVRSDPREWEFFNTFVNGNPVPTAGPPEVWAQFGQGANGTLWFPVLDQPYLLALDAVCFPVTLTADDTVEAIPYLFTDAVPYFAAYIASLSAQQAETAAGMLKLYQMFIARARQFANPSVLPHQYEQATDPEMASRLGVTRAA